MEAHKFKTPSELLLFMNLCNGTRGEKRWCHQEWTLQSNWCLIRHNHYHSSEHSPAYQTPAVVLLIYDLSLSSNILNIINTITQSRLVIGRESEVVGVDSQWLL